MPDAGRPLIVAVTDNIRIDRHRQARRSRLLGVETIPSRAMRRRQEAMMPTPSYPGVYLQETPSGVRPLEVAGTSTAAFVGLAEMGPAEATRVTSWMEFQRRYGTFLSDGFLAHSVLQYFNNGGRQCYIVRVVPGDAVAADVTLRNRAAPSSGSRLTAQTASADQQDESAAHKGTSSIQQDAGTSGVRFWAKSKGVWGNSLLLQIEDGNLDPGNEFKVTVRRQADPALILEDANDQAPLETFDNLSVDPDAPNYVTTVLNRDSALIGAEVTAGEADVQRGRHRGGGKPNLPLKTDRNFEIDIDNDGFQLVQLPDDVAELTDAAAVAEKLQQAVGFLYRTRRRNSTPVEAFTDFECKVGEDGELVLISGTTSATSSVRVQPAKEASATTNLKLGPGNKGRSENGIAIRRPVTAAVVQVGDAAEDDTVLAATPGFDGTKPAEQSFITAFGQLDSVTDFSLLAVPGEASTTMVSAGMGYCANRPLQDVFFLGETDQATLDAEKAADFRNSLTGVNSYGALYFPWVKALDPAGRSREPILLPPTGYVAGLYARVDAARGVWRAPAGTDAGLNGVVGLGVELNDVQHGTLNPIGVNVIRRFPGTGVVAFGARTVTSDSSWRYVPVRRTAIMLRVSIYNGIQWAVFEPNDEPLWSQLRLSIGSFMTTLFRQGAFQGATLSEGFFVKCDGETTTQADIDAGVVNVLVGFAPLKPAEFVIVKISQKAGMASV
ncbi:phage tail sheath family protein [Nonomuraea spiralis]|uniref:Phage tail sheath family protein n=1 Tax=Nonomuraea spiralis TaxID=46182 RepID=A0ABV5IQ61_9ACTN|nr:phage tail sheath C-terminal domain-containing protein [Nonomuraea spiralis]